MDAQLGPGMGRPPRDTESCFGLFIRRASYYEEIWGGIMICIAQSLVRVVSPRELTPMCRGQKSRESGEEDEHLKRAPAFLPFEVCTVRQITTCVVPTTITLQSGGLSTFLLRLRKP